MATSGLVLFLKEFQNSVAQPKMIGSLITTIVVFGQQTTGMSVSYIEFSHVALSIITNEASKISCALFYDREDGKLFGRLVCSEILNAFIQDYASEIPHFGPNLKDFKGFHKRMSLVIYYAVRPVLHKLESMRGILHAIVIKDVDIIDTRKLDLEDQLDPIAVLSKIPLLIEASEEISK